MRSVIAVSFVVALASCRGSSDAPDASTTPAASNDATSAKTPKPRAPSSGGVTIEGDGKGGYHVRGGSKLKGSARACAAYKACCAGRELSLFCGMLEATEKDCEGALTQVKSYASEAKIQLPAGCR
jgi:hypothetical protein